MSTKPEFFKIYKSPEETISVLVRQLNHIFSNLDNLGYVKIILSAGDIQAVPDTRTINSKQLNVDITLTYSDVGAVPTTRQVNSKQLNADITLSASDVGAVPTTRTINTKQLNADITLNASDVGAAPSNILSTGINQNVTIPDIDGTNYHHFTFTSGLLTAYVKNTTP